MNKSQFLMKGETGKMVAVVFADREFGDKSMNIQFNGITEENKQKVKSVMYSDSVKKIQPFVQGDSGGWLMIEFWGGDQDEVLSACRKMLSEAGVDHKEVPGMPENTEFESVFF